MSASPFLERFLVFKHENASQDKNNTEADNEQCKKNNVPQCRSHICNTDKTIGYRMSVTVYN